MEQDLYAAGYAVGRKTMKNENEAQQRYALRDAFDSGYQRARLEVSDILCEVSEFLDNYTDAEYIDGRPVGNRAMRLKASVDELIG